jgi:hypothetical protein
MKRKHTQAEKRAINSMQELGKKHTKFIKAKDKQGIINAIYFIMSKNKLNRKGE